VGARLVGRDLFLDSNTFRDSCSADSEPLVADASLGLTMDLGRAVVSYTHVFRSPDFEAQSGWTQFGSLSFRVPF
jgi:lipid A 3-O-deacylase